MAIDLKPLTTEIIHKMGYSTHDLWVVKVDEEVYGPYEVDSLKHYASENETLFQHALASRTDANDWHPFKSYAQFQSIGEHSHESQEPIKFWILQSGQKMGPLSKFDLQKKLEMHILGMNDLVSMDEGHNWKKFYELETFLPETICGDSLPVPPLESSFSKAREVFESERASQPSQSQGLAAMAFLGLKNDSKQLKLEEIDLKSLNQTEVSQSLKWAAPLFVASFGALAVLSYFMFSPPTASHLTEKEGKTANQEMIDTKSFAHSNQPQSRNRQPSSYGQPHFDQRSGLTQAPTMNYNSYETQTETHYNEPDNSMDQMPEPEPMQMDQSQENSLVSNNVPGNENSESLDQAMATEPAPAPEAPVIEEASDF